MPSDSGQFQKPDTHSNQKLSYRHELASGCQIAFGSHLTVHRFAAFYFWQIDCRDTEKNFVFANCHKTRHELLCERDCLPLIRTLFEIQAASKRGSGSPFVD